MFATIISRFSKPIHAGAFILLLGLSLGQQPISPVYRWCLYSSHAMSCSFVSQSQCTLAAGKSIAWCEPKLVAEPAPPSRRHQR